MFGESFNGGVLLSGVVYGRLLPSLNPKPHQNQQNQRELTKCHGLSIYPKRRGDFVGQGHQQIINREIGEIREQIFERAVKFLFRVFRVFRG